MVGLLGEGTKITTPSGSLSGIGDALRVLFPIHDIPFDDRAASQFDALRSAKIRIGTMDLKIAAIALVNQSVLLSANIRDFEQVPGLRVENWLD